MPEIKRLAVETFAILLDFDPEIPNRLLIILIFLWLSACVSYYFWVNLSAIK